MASSCDLSSIFSTCNLHCLPGRTSSLRPCFFSASALSLSSASQLTFSRFTSHPARLGSICSSFRDARHLPKASEYIFPDPIPEFAEAETGKFKKYLLERLSKKKEFFGNHLEEIVGICSEILREFLHTEYGGPGTLLVIPFIDMADMINERGLPGGPQAARAAVVWAQKHVDIDWKEWTSAAKVR